MRCSRRSAETRYRVSRNMIALILICIVIFAAITIKDLVTGSPLSSSTSTFLFLASSTLCLNVVNLRKAKEELTEE